MSVLTMQKRNIDVDEIIRERNRVNAEHDARVARRKAERAARRAKVQTEREARRLAAEPERIRRQALNEAPRRALSEEIANAITHGLGAVFGIVALILMIVHSGSGLQLMAALFYGICLILLFTISCLYHSFRWGSTVKRVFRRFDYSSIYLLIGGTFAPMFLVYWGNRLGIFLFVTQWIIIVTGITLIAVFGPSRFRPLHMVLYVAIGWSALMFLPGMLRTDVTLFWFTLLGGMLYTLGIVPFAIKVRGSHLIWHFFVLGGALTQWIGIYQCLYS